MLLHSKAIVEEKAAQESDTMICAVTEAKKPLELKRKVWVLPAETTSLKMSSRD